ncbi:MAG TPA: OmpA family protein [Fimbriimonadaceae bacterium]|nr:OmpA family protein [Fimbriimonadaceae bacterium]
MKIKPAGKIVILILVLGVVVGGYRLLTGGGLLSKFMPGEQAASSQVPGKADLPQIPGSAQPAPIGNMAMPSTNPAAVNAPEIRMLCYAWNAQMGLMFANGGPKTTANSLMQKNNVNLSLGRQDDNDKLQAAMVDFANHLHKGETQPTAGATFVIIMGDGSATFLKGLNDNLAKLGADYKAKIVGATGFSRGEDKFMGPQSWKDDPHAAMGGVVAGVIRDGDWNIAQKWLSDNNLKTNPNEKTYDPDALNWVGASDYIDAGTKYIAGYSEDRPVVHNGKPTGEKKHIMVQGVVTWTPGDVNVAEQKGGIVPIVSTADYSAQMPAVIIGIDKWCKANRAEVEGMLQAICRGGDAVKSSSQALNLAGAVSAKVYGEKDADYWVRYYKGLDESDAKGTMVHLGGSAVNNLEDNVMLFGLAPGSANTFAATYRVFGDIVKAQYPNLVSSYAPANEVVDTSYLKDLMDQAPAEQKPKETSKPMVNIANEGATISSRPYNITFATGQASFTPAAKSTLEELLRSLLVASNTVVEIHGHTDNQGTMDSNQKLSERRAFAVKNWLEKNGQRNFEGRIKVFAHGQTEPLVPNDSEAGRAKNRRVEIKIKRVNS